MTGDLLSPPNYRFRNLQTRKTFSIGSEMKGLWLTSSRCFPFKLHSSVSCSFFCILVEVYIILQHLAWKQLPHCPRLFSPRDAIYLLYKSLSCYKNNQSGRLSEAKSLHWFVFCRKGFNVTANGRFSLFRDIKV